MKFENNKLRSLGGGLNNSEELQQKENLKKIQGRYSPASIFLVTIISIASAEVVAMIVVYFQRHLPYVQQVAIDTIVITVITFPILYFLSFRPILLHIRQRYLVEQVLQSRLRIIQYANTHTLDEILRFTLDELESLTGSVAGYFHFIEGDQTTIELQTWSTNTLQNMCRVDGFDRHYSIDRAGVWADCIRQRKVVVHNDYASLPGRKGLPEGHAPIVREMAVPIIRDEKIVAVLGVGNKPTNFTESDVEVVSTLADFTWDIIKQKQVSDTQIESEEKFRTLADWTYDWELWLDPEGNIVYCSPSCQRITDYGPNEFSANPALLIDIVHPSDRNFYEDHHQLIHDKSAGVKRVEYRIVAHSGEEYWIEHICRPVFGDDEHYLGRRISNRDITQRKKAERDLEEQNQKEKILTQTIHTMQLDIARDLHDTIGQNISFLRMKLDYLVDKKMPAGSDDLKTEFSQMSDVANESYDLVRGTLAILQSRGPDDLLQLFKRYASQVVERSALQIEFSEQGEAGSITTHQMRQLFYVFREALSNIEKHSGASHARVRMNWDADVVEMTIEDDGMGFDTSLTEVPSGHYGLKFMRERIEMMNGSFRLKAEPDTGTQIFISVPIQRNGSKN